MVDFCLVIPCYNEASRFDTAAFERFLQAHENVVLYFVDDGSRDRTDTILRQLEAVGEDRVAILKLPSNVGKAEAVRQGMLHALAWRPCEFLGYWDADLAAPLEEASAMLEIARARPDCAIVLGLRLLRLGASIQRPASRHYLGRVFATAASVILRLPVYDTQCGAKLLRSSVVRPVFE